MLVWSGWGGRGGGTPTEESEVYPLYRYEDEMAARILVRAGRAYIARKVLYILRRDKMRCNIAVRVAAAAARKFEILMYVQEDRPTDTQRNRSEYFP